MAVVTVAGGWLAEAVVVFFAAAGGASSSVLAGVEIFTVGVCVCACVGVCTRAWAVSFGCAATVPEVT